MLYVEDEELIILEITTVNHINYESFERRFETKNRNHIYPFICAFMT